MLCFGSSLEDYVFQSRGFGSGLWNRSFWLGLLRVESEHVTNPTADGGQ